MRWHYGCIWLRYFCTFLNTLGVSDATVTQSHDLVYEIYFIMFSVRNMLPCVLSKNKWIFCGRASVAHQNIAFQNTRFLSTYAHLCWHHMYVLLSTRVAGAGGGRGGLFIDFRLSCHAWKFMNGTLPFRTHALFPHACVHLLALHLVRTQHEFAVNCC